MAAIGIGGLLSVLALAQGLGMLLLILTVLYAFLSTRMEGASRCICWAIGDVILAEVFAVPD